MDFDKCNHEWVFHIDVDKCGGPAAGNTVFMCKQCKHLITLKEKVALDTAEATLTSLRHQEKTLENARMATWIGAASLIFTAIVFLYDKILSQ